MPFLETLKLFPEDPILGMPVIFRADSRPKKVNLGIGAYADADGKPFVLTTVREAEKRILAAEMSKEYLPIDGEKNYVAESLKLIFGSDCPRLAAGEVYGAQSIGGTGGLFLGGALLATAGYKTIAISEPAWPNHRPVLTRTGLSVGSYKYYDSSLHVLDFDGFCSSLKDLAPGSIVLLQASCHNPTGMDPTQEQWKELSELMKQQQLIPFFDLAYQGFGDGIEEDAWAVRHFAREGHDMLVASSYSKNFGLYGERVGLLAVVANSSDEIPKISSNVKQIVRGTYSNPSLHGALIVSTVLRTPELRKGWEHELQAMRDRIMEMREALMCGLLAHSLDRDFTFLRKQRGIFSFSGLTTTQVIQLKDEWGVYMISNGRINVAGLNMSNLDYVVNAILAVSKTPSGFA